MKNKLLFITTILALFTTASCKKDLTGYPIRITASTNDTIKSFSFQSTHHSYCPPPGSFNIGGFTSIPYVSGGNYQVQLDEDESNTACISIFGRVPENEDSTGKTIVNIEAFYTKEGNVVGFKNIELKRPHGEFEIIYQFRPETYIE